MDRWLWSEMARAAPRLRARAWLLAGSPEEAEDLVQETLARAWRYRQAFRPGSNLAAWLGRILRNVHVAAQPRLRLMPDPDGRHLARLHAEADQEWRVQLNEALETLDELGQATREAVLLVAASGLTYEQAGAACGCPAGTIKSRVSRARERLARRMAAEAAPSPTAPAAAAR